MLRYVEACRCGRWHLRVWPKDGSKPPWAVPFSCRSWRCQGDCRQWKGAQDFVRIREAIKKREDWVYVVLTYPHNDWPNQQELYRCGVTHWAALQRRFRRRWGDLAYIQTWERHKTGWPHVNVLIGNAEFYKATIEDWREVKRDWLEPNAVAVGFGFRAWIEPMKNLGKMANYLVKRAAELTGAGPKNQIPTNAPPHFRRIRASRGLLPPPAKNPDITGYLCFCNAAEFDPANHGEFAD